MYEKCLGQVAHRLVCLLLPLNKAHKNLCNPSFRTHLVDNRRRKKRRRKKKKLSRNRRRRKSMPEMARIRSLGRLLRWQHPRRARPTILHAPLRVSKPTRALEHGRARSIPPRNSASRTIYLRRQCLLISRSTPSFPRTTTIPAGV